eukprot:gene580-1120_t
MPGIYMLALNALTVILLKKLKRTAVSHLDFENGLFGVAFQKEFQLLNFTSDRMDIDRAVLMDIYEGCGGEDWQDKENWCSELPINKWAGVHTDEYGRVIGLRLWGNRLTGNIPESIGDLTFVKELYLNGNSLTGNLPSSMVKLLRLERFDIHYNQISGGWEYLETLTEMHTLYVDGDITEYLKLPQDMKNKPLQDKFACSRSRALDEHIAAIKDKTRDVNDINIHGDTAIIEASRLGKLSVVKNLIDQGADVNRKNTAGCSALGLALNRQFTAIVMDLIIAGAKPSHQELVKLLESKSDMDDRRVMSSLISSFNPFENDAGTFDPDAACGEVVRIAAGIREQRRTRLRVATLSKLGQSQGFFIENDGQKAFDAASNILVQMNNSLVNKDTFSLQLHGLKVGGGSSKHSLEDIVRLKKEYITMLDGLHRLSYLLDEFTSTMSPEKRETPVTAAHSTSVVALRKPSKNGSKQWSSSSRIHITSDGDTMDSSFDSKSLRTLLRTLQNIRRQIADTRPLMSNDLILEAAELGEGDDSSSRDAGAVCKGWVQSIVAHRSGASYSYTTEGKGRVTYISLDRLSASLMWRGPDDTGGTPSSMEGGINKHVDWIHESEAWYHVRLKKGVSTVVSGPATDSALHILLSSKESLTISVGDVIQRDVWVKDLNIALAHTKHVIY